MRLFNRFQLLLANAPNVQTGSQLARDTPGHHGPGLACHAFKVYASTGAYAPADRGLEPLPDDQYPE
jgi:hypothetical protein